MPEDFGKDSSKGHPPMTATTETKPSRFASTRSEIELANGKHVGYFSLPALAKLGFPGIERLPYSIKVLLESALRNVDGIAVTDGTVESLANWKPKDENPSEIAFKPARVVLQDFTGVPCVVDLAALRSAMKRMGKDPQKIEPLIPVDLVIDHSVQVDEYGAADSLRFNTDMEFQRNRERYEFLRWGQGAFKTLRIVPPGVGIVHQVNLEYLAQGVALGEKDGKTVAYPDSLVGTDSHTTMINGLGIVGWGVGGIEAEAVMLAQPIYILAPEVIGFKLTGKLPEGTTATDLTLTATEMLRKKGVVGKFVEFFGAGLSQLSLADRATLANMAPEYGATMGFFPVDAETLNYLRQTGRSAEQVDLVERYCKAQGMFREDSSPDPIFTDVLELDLATIQASLAGPKRPQDRVALSALKENFLESLTAPTAQRGFGLATETLNAEAAIEGMSGAKLKHGSVAIAAITSCTNTSNPSVMLGAGLLAKKAIEKGLRVAPYVKTSLAPGSRVVTEYLDKAGLTEPLNQLGFFTVGYGCTTCIGNSGPLREPIANAVQAGKLVVSAVLSGNRNFEGRVHPQVQANYLASPPLVVAFAIAGRTDIDLTTEPLGTGKNGKPVFLRDVWPSADELRDALRKATVPATYLKLYSDVRESNPEWNKISVTEGSVYQWNLDSTYIQEPPFFLDFKATPEPPKDIIGARALGVFGDSVTTDHISPAGSIKADSPAGKFLVERGVSKADFNSYGARRGNDRVMTRGTFANIRIKNLMVPGVEGGVTVHLPDGGVVPIYDAAMRYAKDGVPLIILAGKEYGTGSSRDWAAKGTKLLGVRAVIAESFERIHRSNLVGMGILPLQFKEGQNAHSLGLKGREVFKIGGIAEGLEPFKNIHVLAESDDGKTTQFEATLRIDSPIEVEYYKNGGILDYVLREYMKS